MQRVDPFIPVAPNQQGPVLKPEIIRPRAQPPSASGRTLNMLTPTHIARQLSPTATAVSPAVALPMPAASPQPVARPKPRELLKNLAAVVATLAVGTAVQALVVGEVLIFVYAAYTLLRRVASRTTFAMALVSLGVVVLLHVMGKDDALASNFAVYAFLLTMVGVIGLAREVRRA